ncbi:MAG: terpene cyclase/mutase family protein [Pirellulales bacterium]|nr:terpene cyclase/mutase family protein [Pirellulales bacterium]
MTHFLLSATIVLSIGGATLGAVPDARDTDNAELMTEETETAVQQALAWLAARQHDDGSFGSGDWRGNVAVTAIAGMAFMSGGSTPNRGPYGAQVNRTVDYLMKQTEENGFIINRDAVSQGPMYGHGFATLFLAECYGMSRRAELREKLARAVKLIVDAQNKEGGWRYQPDSIDADVSVTICQVMALRAARNAGLHVPKKTIDRCIDYVKKCQNPDGGFAYQLNRDRQSMFARSAAGVVALYSAGVYEGPEIEKGLDYLTRFVPGSRQAARVDHYFYGQYYAAGAMWLSGGARWQKWYTAVRDDLLDRRVDNARYWTSLSYTDDYATAMACIVLQMPNDYLPILQR